MCLKEESDTLCHGVERIFGVQQYDALVACSCKRTAFTQFIALCVQHISSLGSKNGLYGRIRVWRHRRPERARSR